tara:strand:+ start:23705 stop:23944 length:240 start_codon:yes stop_codon:yes gene_type:complete
MLKCREVAELANEYIDKELPWHKTIAMGFHLSMCKHCSGFVQKLRLVVTLVKEQPPETLCDQDAEDIVKTVLALENKSR